MKSSEDAPERYKIYSNRPAPCVCFLFRALRAFTGMKTDMYPGSACQFQLGKYTEAAGMGGS